MHRVESASALRFYALIQILRPYLEMSMDLPFTTTLPAGITAAPAAMIPDSGPEANHKDLRITFASSILLKDFAYWHHHAHWFRKDLYQVLEDALALLAEKYPIPADEPMPVDL
jgi:hypothetical protein